MLSLFRPTRAALVGAAVALTAVGGIAPAQASSLAQSSGTASVSGTSCRTTWGSLPKTVVVPAEPDVVEPASVAMRAGHHACFDRVVIEVKGLSGPVRAAYRRTIVAPDAIVLTWPGMRLPDPSVIAPPSPTLRRIVGHSEEDTGLTIDVVPRAHLPFRMFVIPATAGTNRRVVLDVAHHW